MRNGIDVSVYQREIDWNRAKNYIHFAIIRCGYGNNLISQDDPYYKRNADACTNLKIPFGTYLYSYATNLNMAQSEVDHTLRLIKDYKLEYPVFLDVEDRSQLTLPKEQLVEIVKHYCEKIEEAGYYVGIYASLSTLNGILNSPQLDRFDKWVAEWNKDFNYRGSSGLWQNTDNARIPGIETRVDGDIAFYNYPEIIRENGLNHLDPALPVEPPKENLKYKIGDKLYLNGDLYRNEEGTDIIKEYKNEPVTITRTNDAEKIVAPYYLNVNGYAKESELTADKLTSPSICDKIIVFIKKLFQKE